MSLWAGSERSGPDLGAQVAGDGRVHFRVWAPIRRSVEVAIDGGTGRDERFPVQGAARSADDRDDPPARGAEDLALRGVRGGAGRRKALAARRSFWRGISRATGRWTRTMVPVPTVERIRIENHVATADADHRLLGRTPGRGTVVRLDRRLLDAELKIATGLVEPHFMAGWSGGRKVIAPGVAHRVEQAGVVEGPRGLGLLLQHL